MKHTTTFILFACLALLVACSPSKGNRTGHEYMPDMVHNTGYEANLYDYYYFNRWGSEAEYKKYVMPRHSVNGTIARGDIALADAPDMQARMAALASFNGTAEGSIAITPNGSVPYAYGDTEADRARAMKEITQNPLPITKAGLAHGKELYDIYCGICHGVKGDGQGYLVREADPAKGIPAGVYPAAPANFMLDTFVLATPGRFYHAIMKGRNMMGSYADKLSYEERWDVIHYIRSLQAQAKKLEYSATANTLNQEATPWSMVEASMKSSTPAMPKDTLHREAPAEPAGHKMNQH